MAEGGIFDDLQTVRLDYEADAVVILDQTRLPGERVYMALRTKEDVWRAIYRLNVRGAPAIGVTAAYGIYVCCKSIRASAFGDFFVEFKVVSDFLSCARPTAVNLAAALQRMERCVRAHREKSREEILRAMKAEADAIRREDAAACRAIGEHALTLLEPGMGLLTHCNAGHLAASQYGTALAPVYLGHRRGYGFRVFVDETRPLLQGARLTAFELHEAGVDATLICDNMASVVMSRGWVQAVVVGCDRIAANGDTANKVGTLAVAILARHYGIPFYVLGPTSTIDRTCRNGDGIVIEERDPDEVTDMWYRQRMAPQGVAVYNPSFDVTPHGLITAIITEKGIAREPFGDPLREWSERG